MSTEQPIRSDHLFAILRDEIRSGTHRIGSRLPTERELIARFGASRVAVREALAALRSVGLVASRQGSGVYVAADGGDGEGVVLTATTHAEILDCLELRLAIEVEAAGLAATRRSMSQLDRMTECLAQMKARVDAAQASSEPDWAFHLEIAKATGNEYYGRFMAGLGPGAIPRSQLQKGAMSSAQSEREVSLLEEHLAVLRAIASQDSEAARVAMRVHLGNAIARYREMRVSDTGIR